MTAADSVPAHAGPPNEVKDLHFGCDGRCSQG